MLTEGLGSQFEQAKLPSSESERLIEQHRNRLEQIYTPDELKTLQLRLKTLEEGLAQKPPNEMTLWLLHQSAATLLGLKPLTLLETLFKRQEEPGVSGAMFGVTAATADNLRDYLRHLSSINPNFDFTCYPHSSQMRSTSREPQIYVGIDVFSPTDISHYLNQLPKSLSPDHLAVFTKLGLTSVDPTTVLEKLKPVLEADSYSTKPISQVVDSLSKKELGVLYGILYGYPESTVESESESHVRSGSEVYNIVYDGDDPQQQRDAQDTRKRYDPAYALVEEVINKTVPNNLPRRFENFLSGEATQ